MNIELDEVVVLAVSDDALEMAAGGAQGGLAHTWHDCCTVGMVSFCSVQD